MTNTKQIIITLNAKALFDYFPKKPTENNQCFKLDFSDPVHSYAGTAKISAWQSTQDTREEETARKSRSDRDHRPIRRRLLPEHAVWQPASMSMG